MNNPKISVIVPVYNVEKYLPRCIESILIQTYSDFELLLIDDGSMDKSGEICDKYSKRDSRIRVFHKINGGVASARQIGVDNAEGIYSIHADGDDWMEADALECMYTKICETQCDILIADYWEDTPYKDKKLYRKQRPSSPETVNVLEDILYRRLFGALWNKMIRHSLYNEYHVRFIENINYCEDVLIWAQLLQYKLKITYLGKAFYHYNMQNNNSITRHYTEKTLEMRKKYLSKLEILLSDYFKNIIPFVASDIKFEAMVNGCLSEKDFLMYYPISLKTIYSGKNGIISKLRMFIFWIGNFKMAQMFFKLNLAIGKIILTYR